MPRFKLYNKLAEVYRQSETTDSGYTKSSFSTTGKTYYGHLKAQSIENSVELGGFGKVFKFTTESGADIEESDRLIIDGSTYDVKGVSEYSGITFSSRKILLNKS